MENNKFLVRVNCMTFNHAPYILDAMTGFTLQETTFPYICVIVDDASTDGEQEVIQHYIENQFEIEDSNVFYKKDTDDYYLTFTRHKINKNCYFAIFYLKYNHYKIKKPKYLYWQEWVDTKYIAICEGDDYWINKNKLQKQVDFLEKNPDYTMCFHSALEHYEYGNTHDRIFSQIENRDYSGIEMFQHWIVPTASVVFKRKIYESSFMKSVVKNNKFIYGDIKLFLSCASLGKVRGFGDTMSVYRRNVGSITYLQTTKDYEYLKKRAYHFLEVYKVFGISYKKTSIKIFSILMISGFADSIKKKHMQFDFLKESLNVSVINTIKALLWETKKIAKDLIKKRNA